MDFIDYYAVLGLPRTASEDDIRKAYRKLARKHHPDLNPDHATAKQKFQQIAEANEVLSSPEDRKKYDEYGKDWKHADQIEEARRQQSQYAGAGGGASGGGQGFGGEDFSDFFNGMFGAGAGGGARSGRGGNARFRGQDVQATLQLDLRDVYRTHKQTFNLEGGKPVRITIHAGAEDGQTIKLAGYGGPGTNGGPVGDLYITFNIANATGFRRQGADLYKDAPLDLYTAVLGGEVTTDAFEGQVKLKVKPGTQSGETVRLKGKGFPVYRQEGQYGDLYVTWKVQVPAGLSEREKELFTELKNLSGDVDK